MTLNTSISQFSNGSAINDTVTPGLTDITTHSSSLSVLDQLPGISAARAAMESMASAASAQWSAVLAQLPVALPAMKAVHLLEKKLEMSDGGIPSSAGSASFSNYFGAIDSVKTATAGIQASISSTMASLTGTASGIPGVTGTGPAALSSLAATIPPATIPDPANPGMTIENPAYTAFMSSNGTALTQISANGNSLNDAATAAATEVTGHFSTANSAFAGGMASLKAYAFASFCASPQPAPVQAAIAQTINPASIPRRDAVDQANSTSSNWAKGQQTTADTLAPVVASKTPEVVAGRIEVSDTVAVQTQATSTQRDAIQAQIDGQYSVIKSAADAADVPARTFKTWMLSVNYAEAKNNAATDPTTYEALRAQGQQRPEYIDMTEKLGIWNSARLKLADLNKIRNYMNTTGPWPGNPDGPW